MGAPRQHPAKAPKHEQAVAQRQNGAEWGGAPVSHTRPFEQHLGQRGQGQEWEGKGKAEAGSRGHGPCSNWGGALL